MSGELPGGPPSGIEASEKFHLALRELELALPAEYDLMRIHVATIAQEILRGARQPQEAVDLIHREVLAPFNHPEEFMPWCYLWEGLDPDGFATLDDAALDEAIVRVARAWTSKRTA